MRETAGCPLCTVYIGYRVRLTGYEILTASPVFFSGVLVADRGETQLAPLVAGGRHIPDTRS